MVPNLEKNWTIGNGEANVIEMVTSPRRFLQVSENGQFQSRILNLPPPPWFHFHLCHLTKWHLLTFRPMQCLKPETKELTSICSSLQVDPLLPTPTMTIPSPSLTQWPWQPPFFCLASHLFPHNVLSDRKCTWAYLQALRHICPIGITWTEPRLLSPGHHSSLLPHLLASSYFPHSSSLPSSERSS